MNRLKKFLIGCAIIGLSTSYMPENGANTQTLDNYLKQDQEFQEVSRDENDRLRRWNSAFENVYKFTVRLTGKARGVFFDRKVSGSLYNFKDGGNRSYYITAGHLLKPQHPLLSDVQSHEKVVVDMYGETLEGKLERLDLEKDYAIISTKKDKYKAYRTPPISYKNLIIGEECYIGGYPGGRFRVIKKSNITAIIHNKDTGEIRVCLDEVVRGGYSGGPVFVKRKNELRFVGIVISYNDNQGISHAVPYDVFENQFKKY